MGFAGCWALSPGGSPGEDPFCAVAGADLVTGCFVVLGVGAFVAVGVGVGAFVEVGVGLGGGFGGAVG